MMSDGIIELDSEFGKKIGFTSDKFNGYLWKEGNEITISFIISKDEGQGNFSNLIRGIAEKGYAIAVPTPLGTMTTILSKLGFKRDEQFEDEMEIWRLTQKQKVRTMRNYVRIVSTSRFTTDGEGLREPGDEEDVRFEVVEHELIAIEFKDGTGVYFDTDEFMEIVRGFNAFRIWDSKTELEHR